MVWTSESFLSFSLLEMSLIRAYSGLFSRFSDSFLKDTRSFMALEASCCFFLILNNKIGLILFTGCLIQFFVLPFNLLVEFIKFMIEIEFAVKFGEGLFIELRILLQINDGNDEFHHSTNVGISVLVTILDNGWIIDNIIPSYGITMIMIYGLGYLEIIFGQ